MYSSAEKILKAIDTTGFNDRMYHSYYNAYIAYYTALGNEFDTDRSKAVQNIRSRYIYQEKLSNLPVLTDQERIYIKGKQLMLEERYDEALDSLHKVLKMDKVIASRLHKLL